MDQYFGDTLNGQKHGYGKIIYKEGHIYHGEWKHDKYHGEGKLTLNNG